MELEGKEEEGEAMVEDEEEAKIPKAAQPKSESKENAEDNESGSTDSGQENSGETRLLRSGTYSDRTESKAYGSVTHKCEVRAAAATARLPFLGAAGITVHLSACRTAERSSPTLGTSSGTSASTPVRNPSPAGSAIKPSQTQRRAKPTRRRTGMVTAAAWLSRWSCDNGSRDKVGGGLLCCFPPCPPHLTAPCALQPAEALRL